MPQLSLEQDSSGGLVRRYLYGEGRISVTTPQTTAYFSVDTVGSTTALSDTSGASLGNFDRQPFGDGATGSGVDPSVANVPVGFTGELQDPVTGLVDLRARNYDPATGRFLSTDLLGRFEVPSADDGFSAYGGYSYAGDSPLVFTDPSGLKYGDGCNSFACLAFHTAIKGCWNAVNPVSQPLPVLFDATKPFAIKRLAGAGLKDSLEFAGRDYLRSVPIATPLACAFGAATAPD